MLALRTDPLLDLTGNGMVDFSDFFVFADAFGGGSQAKLLALAQEHLCLPPIAQLGHNYPNPFNPSTTISYRLARDEDVVLTIWSLAGQLVRDLVHAPQPAGHYSVTWDGRAESGSLVANGVYLYQIRAGDFQMARKMVLMK